MRNLIVTVVAVLAVVLLSPAAQAGQVPASAQNAVVTSPCSDCDKNVNTTDPVLQQWDADETQSIGDHPWGGDPNEDPAYAGWVHWWWYVMTYVYYYHLDEI